LKTTCAAFLLAVHGGQGNYDSRKQMSSDLTFITNEKSRSLKARFGVLIKDTAFFDCLVGYFYTSGFHAIYKSLEKTERIRILIGISTNRQTYEMMHVAGEAQTLRRARISLNEGNWAKF